MLLDLDGASDEDNDDNHISNVPTVNRMRRDPYDRRCFLDLDTDSRHLLILISPRDLGLKNTRTHGKASVEQSQSQTHPNQNRDPSGRAPTWGEDCGQNHACSKTKDSQPKPKPTRVFYPGGQGNLPTKGHGFKPKRAERFLDLGRGRGARDHT